MPKTKFDTSGKLDLKKIKKLKFKTKLDAVSRDVIEESINESNKNSDKVYKREYR